MRYIRTEKAGYGRLDWWAFAPLTLHIAEAIAFSETPNEDIERGWEWARATRDACGMDGSGPAAISWNRAAEVLAGLSVYRSCLLQSS